MLTSLATVKHELGIDDVLSDLMLTRLIAQSTADCEAYCERSFARLRAVDRVLIPLNMSTMSRLSLPRYPLIMVYSIVWETSGDTVDPASYVVASQPGAILYRARGWSPWSIDTNPNAQNAQTAPSTDVSYLIDYDAGYDDPAGPPGTPAAPVPANLEGACIEAVKTRYFGRRRDASVKVDEIAGVGRTEYFAPSVGVPDSGLPSLVTGALDPFRNLSA